MVTKLLCFFVISTILSKGQGQSSFEDTKETYLEAAKECLKSDPPKAAVPIKKTKPLKFDCVTLLEKTSDFQDNCRSNEWLTLQRDAKWEWKPRCLERPCGGSVPVRRVRFERLDGDCKDLGDPEPCKNGEVVRHTIHGYGVCSRKLHEDEFANISSTSNGVTDTFSVSEVRKNCEATDAKGNCVDLITIEIVHPDISELFPGFFE